MKDREKALFKGDIPAVDQGVDVAMNLPASSEQSWLEMWVSMNKLPESREDIRTFR